MEYIVKKFSELSNFELYNLLKIRQEVFVVEQKCIYLDCDEKDFEAIHIFLKKSNGDIIGCIRVLNRGVSYEESSIGRVLIAPKERGKGYAKEIFQKGIDYIFEVLKEDKIQIGAQAYLKDFYKSFGFFQVSEEYDEDGIFHMDMLLEKKDNLLKARENQ